MRDRDSTLLCAIEDGFVIATRVKRNGALPADAEEFLRFVADRKSKTIRKIILSHFSEEETAAFRQFFPDGYEVTERDCNPLVGAALVSKTRGKDEEVLNLNAFLSRKKSSWWRRQPEKRPSKA